MGLSVFEAVGKTGLAIEGVEILCCDEEHTVLGGKFVGVEDDSTLAVL